MGINFHTLQKSNKMISTKNIFEHALSIKNLVDKVKQSKSGIITFMTTGSCLDTGPTLFVSNQNFPFTHAATNK
jgi:hypothetical protein